MTIKPTQLAVTFLFEQNHTFQVPKYQRGYAWDDEAIEDFVEDISRCVSVRATGGKRNHFFGGIVTVRSDVPNSNRSNYEVIDGQQRLASFVMLAGVIVRSMRDVVGDLVKKGKLSAGENKAKDFLEQTINSLKGLYLAYRDQKELEYVDVPKLTLSHADDDFFQKVLEGSEPKASRASHERIQAAWTRLQAFVTKKALKDDGAEEKAKRLQLLIGSVLAEDCTVIFMCSDTRAEAYQIFQVLNDRGVHLTDGDLLRARTMELLDQKSLLPTQSSVSIHWDRVLGYPPGDIDSYLRWYFSSLEGKRPKSSNLADQFLECRFGCKDQQTIDKKAADRILEEVKLLDAEFAQLRTLGDGDWPFTDHGGVTSWDRERLRMLVVNLKHTNAMPLLLSLRLLDAKKFAEAVACLERFVFRYKTVGNAHIGPMTELYLRHAKKIRETSGYTIKGLRNDLAALAGKVVSDKVFEANLRDIRYSPHGGNGHIRYLLITLEDYHKWYEQGAQGVTKCKDKTRVFDFSNTTLEHIYPQSIDQKSQDTDLEKIKHTLGNLTTFGPEDNDKVRNKPFADKRLVLKASSLKLNREVGESDKWTAAHVSARTDKLVKMALKIFVP
jgi:Protein of unknown function DUF262/Protein of unknown function (DUF1524)